MKYRVFIDGREGTTGLQIEDKIKQRDDLELLTIDDRKRKDPGERRKCINQSDVSFLCLPDAAAMESVALCDNPHTVIIDTSTAHRVDPAWVYGFPELSRQRREAIGQAKRISNPGCHATGFLAAAYPLIAGGILSPDAQLACHSITGYSGGGKKMIAAYESPNRPQAYAAPRQYGITQQHKHLAEMAFVSGLTHPPVFCPIVCDFYSGMAVTVSICRQHLLRGMDAAGLRDYYRQFYRNERLIEISDPPRDGFIAGNELAGQSGMKIYAVGNEQRMTVTTVFDNLQKGASGAAVQNMNLALGLYEYESISS